MAFSSAMWRRLDVPDGLVHGTLSELDPAPPRPGEPEQPEQALLFDGAAVAHDEHGPWSVRFSVVVDDRWFTRSTFVETLSHDGLERLTLSADALGAWTLDGRPWPQLEGCSDVDISASPLTNTMPVRRLGLQVGEEAEIDVAWVDMPSLAVHRVRQSYRRLPDIDGRAAYRYADPGFGPFTMTVDDLGLVVEYQSLFQRVR